MFIPFISQRLDKRKGGGGGGRSGGGGKSSGGKSSSSGKSSGGTTKSPFSKTSSTSISGRNRPLTSYGFGGGAPSVIPAGQLYAGRAVGGGFRNQVFGTRTYGSGYPGVVGRGVTGRGFPFYFWPMVWGGTAGAVVGRSSYLYTDEYGSPSNTSRPGGALYTASFQSNDSTTLRIVADNATVSQLVTDVSRNCSTYIMPQSLNVVPFNTSAPAPKPEQVIQYYRASSVALSLDGYNNTSVFASEDTKNSDVPLPSTVNNGMINCVNQTIGASVPLIDGGLGRFDAIPGFQVFGIVSLVWLLAGMF